MAKTGIDSKKESALLIELGVIKKRLNNLGLSPHPYPAPLCIFLATMAPRTRSSQHLNSTRETYKEPISEATQPASQDDNAHTSTNNTKDATPSPLIFSTQIFSTMSCSLLISSFALLMPFYQGRLA